MENSRYRSNKNGEISDVNDDRQREGSEERERRRRQERERRRRREQERERERERENRDEDRERSRHRDRDRSDNRDREDSEERRQRRRERDRRRRIEKEERERREREEEEENERKENKRREREQEREPEPERKRSERKQKKSEKQSERMNNEENNLLIPKKSEKEPKKTSVMMDLSEFQEKGYMVNDDIAEIYYNDETFSFHRINPYEENDFFNNQVYAFNESIYSINSLIHQLYCKLKRYKNSNFFAHEERIISILGFVLFVLAFFMYLVTISSDENITKFFDDHVWVVIVILIILLIASCVIVFRALGVPYVHGDLEHGKEKIIRDKLDLLNEYKFRKMGYTLNLKKKTLFEFPEMVDPPKDDFDTEDENECNDGLNIQEEKANWYIKHEEKLARQVVDTSFEHSEDSDDDHEDSILKKKKEIRELWFISVERNF